jgi:hypothetical protein
MAVPQNFQVAFNHFFFVFVFVGRKRPIILTDDGLDGLVIRVLLGTARTSSSMEPAKRSEINGVEDS